MKLEDVKDQSALDALIADKVKAAITGMTDKNDELLGKLKAAKDNAAPDDIEDLKAAMLELKKLKDGKLEEQGEYKKLLDATREQHSTELEKIQGLLKAEQSSTRRLLIQEGLSSELGRHNVNPVLIESAIALLANDISIIEENGNKVAKVGEKTLDIYVKDWVSSDIGKNFTLASANSGGGAGGNGSSSTQSESEKHFLGESWNLTEQAKLSKTDPTQYKQLHEKHPTREASGQQ